VVKRRMKRMRCEERNVEDSGEEADGEDGM
jgi:hypothetical protein